MECALVGLGPMRARGSGPDFLFALADAGHTIPQWWLHSAIFRNRSNAGNPFVTLIFRRNDVTLRVVGNENFPPHHNNLPDVWLRNGNRSCECGDGADSR